MLAASDFSLDLTQLLSIAQTLSFAVPVWGPLIAAGFQLVQYIFGGSGTNPMEVVFKALATIQSNIINAIAQSAEFAVFREQLNLLQGHADWLTIFATTLKSMQDHSDLNDLVDKIIENPHGYLINLMNYSTDNTGTMFLLVSDLIRDPLF